MNYPSAMTFFFGVGCVALGLNFIMLAAVCVASMGAVFVWDALSS